MGGWCHLIVIALSSKAIQENTTYSLQVCLQRTPLAPHQEKFLTQKEISNKILLQKVSRTAEWPLKSDPYFRFEEKCLERVNAFMDAHVMLSGFRTLPPFSKKVGDGMMSGRHLCFHSFLIFFLCLPMSGKIGGRSCITFTDVKGLFLFSEDDIADFFSQVERAVNVRIVFD